jgi:hypothetical protein
MSTISRDARLLNREKGIRTFCFVVVSEHSNDSSPCRQDASRIFIVGANAPIMKMHFRRKTTIEESKFPSVSYRVDANA